MNNFLCCTLVLLGISVKWTAQEAVPPKYLHNDPETARQIQCDQCPPGTFVQQHCTPSSKTVCAPCPDEHYTDEWNSDAECQYCNTVCKDLQYEKVECSSTHNRVCECFEGWFLDLEFCRKHTACAPGYGVAELGTPESDTVCVRCPKGYFSSETSSTEACRKHTSCKALGLKRVQKGDAMTDNICRQRERK